MNQTVAYSPTTVDRIGSSLNRLFGDMDRADGGNLRAANTNMLVTVSGPADLPALESVLERLVVVNPGRIFVVVVNDALSEISAEVSARCNIISKSERICSEVIRIISPTSMLQAIPGIIRSNLVTGIATELFIFRKPSHPVLLDLLIPLCDELVYDSSSFEDDLSFLRTLSLSTNSLVDLQWVGLGPWRDEVKDVFARFASEISVGRLSEIRTVALGGSSSIIPTQGLLMSGWLIDRLGVEPVAYGKGGFECKWRNSETPGSASDGIVRLEVELSHKVGESELKLVSFTFLKNGALPGAVVTLSKGSGIESTISWDSGTTGRAIKLSRPIDATTLVSRLERYYLIGESTVNYRGALKIGLELEALRRGVLNF